MKATSKYPKWLRLLVSGIKVKELESLRLTIKNQDAEILSQNQEIESLRAQIAHLHDDMQSAINWFEARSPRQILALRMLTEALEGK